jgi:hypothetical protein
MPVRAPRSLALSPGLVAGCAATVTAQPIAPQPENPRFLITSGEHYGAILNRDFDFLPYLDELHARGFNLTRTSSGTYREVPGSFQIRNARDPGIRDRWRLGRVEAEGPGSDRLRGIAELDEVVT